jgi:MEMO1 family protein
MGRDETANPKLRLIDAQPVQYEGASYLMLRDPLALSEQNILVPQVFIPALALCDGTRSASTLRAALAIRYGLVLSQQRIEEFITALDDALLLENPRSGRARAETQAAFRQAPFRPPANAGVSYPANPQELSRYLQGFFDAQIQPGAAKQNGSARGIVSPHIDFERGGPIYARVWQQAADSVRNAELAIIFGTDHFSEGFPISLTLQNYATPFGVLPTSTQIVNDLARTVGPGNAFAGEIHHRREHSIELAAVWMHHIRGGRPIETVPILTGSMETINEQLQGSALDSFLAVLRKAAAGRRTLVIAAGDLAHVGPAFGGDPVDPGKLILLKSADDALIEAMCGGNAEQFYGAIRQIGDQNNVCGVSPIYLTLRLLAPLHGQNQGYAVCPADANQTSVVTICGVTLQ